MSDTFCILPYIHHHIDVEGKNRLCCVAKPNPNLKSFGDEEYVLIRDKMSKGNQISDCERCWNKEKHGLTSFRQKANAKWKLSVPSLYNDKVISVDYRLTNHCNFACVFCGAHNSTKWATLQNIHNGLNKNEPDIDTEKLEYVYLAGGEPLLVPQFKNFVKNIKNKDKTEIVINTNLSQIDDEWIEILSSFNKKCLTISVDAYGEICEYIRWPFDWTKFQNNIDKIKNTDIAMMFNCVMCNINYLDFELLADWMATCNPVMIDITECISPRELNFDLLKKYHKDVFATKTKQFANHPLVDKHPMLKKFFLNQLKNINIYNRDVVLDTTKFFLKKQDIMKQTNFSTVKCTFNELFNN